jgi:transcription-repair coupling factor (superfamily II helicase)
MGFSRPHRHRPGEDTIRGGLIDLFPPARAPVRLDLFGDVLESAPL